jgi:hypothetical protein
MNNMINIEVKGNFMKKEFKKCVIYVKVKNEIMNVKEKKIIEVMRKNNKMKKEYY